MEDDTKLKIVFFGIIVIYTLAIIGLWENLIQPALGFFGDNWPAIRKVVLIFFGLGRT